MKFKANQRRPFLRLHCWVEGLYEGLLCGKCKRLSQTASLSLAKKDIFALCTKGLLSGGFVADSSFVYLCARAGRVCVYVYVLYMFMQRITSDVVTPGTICFFESVLLAWNTQ